MTPVSPARSDQKTTIAQLVEEVADLSVGAVTVFLPFLILAVPGIALVVVPVIAAGAVVAIAGALLALPFLPLYLLLRAVRRRHPEPARGPSIRPERVAPHLHARPTSTH